MKINYLRWKDITDIIFILNISVYFHFCNSQNSSLTYQIKKLKAMKNSAKKNLVIGCFAFLLCGSIFTSCTSNDKSSTETTTTEIKNDSIPPVDKDSNTTTRPETIKNGTAPTSN